MDKLSIRDDLIPLASNELLDFCSLDHPPVDVTPGALSIAVATHHASVGRNGINTAVKPHFIDVPSLVVRVAHWHNPPLKATTIVQQLNMGADGRIIRASQNCTQPSSRSGLVVPVVNPTSTEAKTTRRAAKVSDKQMSIKIRHSGQLIIIGPYM